MVEHTIKAFDEEINRLRGLVAEMGGRVEKALEDAMAALVQRDYDKAQRVVAADRQVDALEAEVEKLVIQTLALRAPMANDLREVVAALKIVGVVERIGDYAKNIAKRSAAVEGRSRIEPLTLLPAMSEIAAAMVHDVLDAYAARDAEKASAVIARDQKVDNFYDSIFRNLVSHMMENPTTISSAAQLLFVAKNLERIGDHATNIAEMVHYAATGTHPAERERGTGGPA